MDEDEAYAPSNVKLYPCRICERSFRPEVLGKHQSICEKNERSKSKRKIFDSGKQRATGSDVIYAKTKETKKVQIEGVKVEQNSSTNWREKHNELIKSLRYARNASEAIKTGAPLPKYEPSTVPSDYINCQYCGRNFNKNAGERHIAFCEKQHLRQKINNSAQKAKPKYQPPLPGQRKQSSEAYGQSNYSNNGNAGSSTAAAAYSNGYSNRGHHSGSMIKGASSGNDRRPVRYDSNLYYDNDAQEVGAGGAYATKNKMMIANKNAKQPDQMLRTGRNITNSELNALARNRSGNNSQKESPLNSRDPSINRRQAVSLQNGTRAPAQQLGPQRGVSQTQNGTADNYGAGYANPAKQFNGKFCHECGSEFPVQWARFCSYCGNSRV